MLTSKPHKQPCLKRAGKITARAPGNAANRVEVDFYIVPTKNRKLMAGAYCTKHGLWHSDEVAVEVNE